MNGFAVPVGVSSANSECFRFPVYSARSSEKLSSNYFSWHSQQAISGLIPSADERFSVIPLVWLLHYARFYTAGILCDVLWSFWFH